jgi:2-polyprenyl-6-methoxyphenol hydroxylase-like FAD-dependent oxidoreductase
MDRADVIIFGGGLVGLALAAALESSAVARSGGSPSPTG